MIRHTVKMEESRSFRFVWLVLALFVFQVNFPTEAREVYITYDASTKQFQINKQSVQNWVAYGNFTNAINETGWSYLDAVTRESSDDELQAYGAGLAEGYLTADLIKLNWMNTVAGYCDASHVTPFCNRLKTFLNANLEWMYSQIEQLADRNPLWHQVRLFLIQLNALHDGYTGVPGNPSYIVKDPFGFLMFQIGGDLEDLESALHKEGRHHIRGSGSCSALIKLLPNNADLYVSQDTWSGFESMLRILKKYDFGFHMIPGSDLIPGRAVSFSSYPGTLYSGDDFYILSSGLVTLETTIGNGNPALWKYVQPKTILEGIRTVVANRMADSGLGWSSLFQQHNSGTYNNEWMVVDYKMFTPNQPLPKYGVLVVLEQLPGFVKYDDLTWLLTNQTYFPSYNIPYFKEVFNMSGGPGAVAQYGDWFSYDHAPRANIFRRDHSKVVDIPSMMKLMRYNDFKHDPLARCNCTPPYSGENAISARSDLNPANGTYPFSALGQRLHGGTDMKLTTSGMCKDLSFVAISGPTYDQQPPFRWSTSPFATKSHLGIPDLMKFEPQVVEWVSREKN